MSLFSFFPSNSTHSFTHIGIFLFPPSFSYFLSLSTHPISFRPIGHPNIENCSFEFLFLGSFYPWLRAISLCRPSALFYTIHLISLTLFFFLSY
ncbi:MAG: hypothetical protein J3R72DRAFT_439446 [Linnemannia gamsii]|nr:MAG: hypothetical protein J3R72DRAFT_439446 [Linnemannia gamsii]